MDTVARFSARGDDLAAHLSAALQLLQLRDHENDRLKAALLESYAVQWSMLSGRSVEDERAALDEAQIMADVLGPSYWKAA